VLDVVSPAPFTAVARSLCRPSLVDRPRTTHEATPDVGSPARQRRALARGRLAEEKTLPLMPVIAGALGGDASRLI
jgi:hypothetical protein